MIKNSTQPVLMQKLFELLETHRSAFMQERIYWRVVGMVLGEVFNFGRHTVTQGLMALGITDGDWSGWYRLFSKERYEERKVAKVFFRETLEHTSIEEPYVVGVLFTHIDTQGCLPTSHPSARFGGILEQRYARRLAMEEQWIVDRGHLRRVWLEHPEWSKRQLAEAVGHSKCWVKKWLKRIRRSTLEDQEVLQAYSRARKRPPPRTVPEVVSRILEIRDEPPPKLGRVPGPVTILYYLKKDAGLQEAGYVLPRSTRTIWKILDQHQRIPRPGPRSHEPLERPEPGLEWGMDFHDVSTVPADPLGKQQHVVEILNFVDHPPYGGSWHFGRGRFRARGCVHGRNCLADGGTGLPGTRLPGPHCPGS